MGMPAQKTVITWSQKKYKRAFKLLLSPRSLLELTSAKISPRGQDYISGLCTGDVANSAGGSSQRPRRPKRPAGLTPCDCCRANPPPICERLNDFDCGNFRSQIGK